MLDRVLRAIVVNPAALTKPRNAHDLQLADASFDERLAQQLAALFAEHETWHCPTLIRLHTQQFPDEPEHSADPRLRFIAPDEVDRWRKATAKFARLPERPARHSGRTGRPSCAGQDALRRGCPDARRHRRQRRGLGHPRVRPAR